jgi:hypothetical protein
MRIASPLFQERVPHEISPIGETSSFPWEGCGTYLLKGREMLFFIILPILPIFPIKLKNALLL